MKCVFGLTNFSCLLLIFCVVFISFLNFSDLGLGSIRELHAKVIQSLKQFGGEVPQKFRLSTISLRKSRLFSQ